MRKLRTFALEPVLVRGHNYVYNMNKLDKTAVFALRDKILGGEVLTDEEAYSLVSADREALRDSAAAITRSLNTLQFDSCSIVNARSGRCPENCKWCAQSAHYNTHCTEYPLVDHDECMAAAHNNAGKGVHRFSLVASGRSVTGKTLTSICSMLREAAKETGIETCASLGLLGREQLQQLWDAGVRRYHCNLETAPSHFATLCTTHTIADKKETIRIAREIGFQICSGGIIGMGETPKQRVEFALDLRTIAPDSIPLNILSPIPGTPLQDTELLSEDEFIDTVAIFRFIHPRTQLRFAGGRARLSREGQIEAMRVGINGGITGDLLTTTGSTIDTDKALVNDAGYIF